LSREGNAVHTEFFSNVMKQDLIQGHCLWPCVNIWKTQSLQLLENTCSALRIKFNFEQSVVCTTQVFRCWEYLPSFRLWDKLVRNNMGFYFWTVHVVTFTLFKTNSCTSFKHTLTSTF
jgi:hypothetical protein